MVLLIQNMNNWLLLTRANVSISHHGWHSNHGVDNADGLVQLSGLW